MKGAIKQSKEFDIAFQFITQTNKNLFLTGKAGTGKTTFLKYLKLNTHKNVVTTAPTGVAAINAGGVTLHSLFQLPFAPYIPVEDTNKNTLNKHRYWPSQILSRIISCHRTKAHQIANRDIMELIEKTEDLDNKLSAQKGIKVEFETINEANHFFSKNESVLIKCLDKYIKKETALY